MSRIRNRCRETQVITSVLGAFRDDCGCPPVCNQEAGSISAGSTSASLGEVIFSNSNGVTFGMSGQVVTASFSAGSQSGIDISISGNTAGVPALISSGTAVFFGGNNITLAQIGNSLTISGTNQSTQTQNCVDVSLAGNTSGTLALVSSGTLILAGGNNITLSQNGQSVTISANAELGVDLSISGNTSGTKTLIASGTAILAGGNNITLSQNGQSITISAASQSAQTVQTQNLFDLSLSGNTSGALALISSGTAILAGGNNITLSQNGQSITISGANTVAAGGTLHRFIPHEIIALGVPQDQSLYFMWMTVPERVEFDNVLSHVSLHVNNLVGTLSAKISCHVGIYTNNASTLSLQGSASALITFNDSSNGSNDSLEGWRHFPVPFTSTLTAGEYWVGMFSKTGNTGSAGWTASNMAVANVSTTLFNGSLGLGLAGTNVSMPGWDFYTGGTTSGNLPNSMAWTDIGSRYGGNHNIGPYIVFNSGSF